MTGDLTEKGSPKIPAPSPPSLMRSRYPEMITSLRLRLHKVTGSVCRGRKQWRLLITLGWALDLFQILLNASVQRKVAFISAFIGG